MTKIFRKTDIALIVIFLALAVSWYFILAAFASPGGTVIIDGEGGRLYTLSMREYDGRTIIIETNRGTNHVLIESHQVSMVYADCPDHDCVHMGAISNTVRTITCMPNRINVRLEGVTSEGSDFDVITR